MRHKKVKLVAILLLGLGLSGIQAQTMYVKQNTGTQAAYVLTIVRKITFSSGNLTITKNGNSTDVYALNGLRYLNFIDLTTGLDKSLKVQKQILVAYPNPVGNILNIDLGGTIQGEGKLCIHNVEGKLVIDLQVNQTGVLQIGIAHLRRGIYLCQYSNAKEIKTVKIIKQ